MSELRRYFYNALIVYIETGQEEERIAALSSVMLANTEERNKQRQSLQDLITTIKQTTSQSESELPEFIDHTNDMFSRLSKVEEEIKNPNWSGEDIKKQLNILKSLNKTYFTALNNRNADIFVSNYPNIFK
jgi:chromosome segregation ATPase